MTEGRSTDGILAAAANAERFRRQRLLTRLLLRVVPAAAGLVLLVAAIVRFAHLPLLVFWSALGASIAGVALFAWLRSRVPAVTDAAAARLDDDAALGGELRSGHWFASHETSDPWAAYHVTRATERVESISWQAVYPPLRTARVWAGSTAMGLAAIALVLSSAWPRAAGTAGAAGERGTLDAGLRTGTLVPADLQKQIDELIKSVQNGTMPMDMARAKMSALRDAVADLDPKLQAALAKSMKERQPSDWNADNPDPEIDALAKKAEEAAGKADLPQDLKWSLQDLAEKLSKANRPSENAADSAANKADQGGGASKEQAAPSDRAAGVQMTRNTGADSQSTQMMTTNGPMDGVKVDPRGAEAAKGGRSGEALNLAALRKETILADADSQGSNVLSELRRKSEQSHSAIAFSHVPPLAAYDKSHATPPPSPSDALRPLVKQYFIRR
ncbi:MAG: hypothetical protein EPO35_10775 [Acidobacteria bacterium]|nr:MAG: hypothetical protein EPO35_10775 [Acidobacteriota bacterium]